MIFFDTNILIAHQCGHAWARQAILETERRCISVIVEMEFMSGFDAASEALGRSFLSHFEVIGLSLDIVDLTIQLRREGRFKLPDAIIYATAKRYEGKLMTCNHKDFDRSDPMILIPSQMK